MTDFATVLTTVADAQAGRAMATALVEARLAACVQLLPITSIYRWAGEVEEAQEQLLIGKIADADFPHVEAAILAHHTYEVPEIIKIPIAAGYRPYLAWLAASTTR